jgi:bifunctional ADP-heptose synthase (sugar kinase/adenylyltransferase)
VKGFPPGPPTKVVGATLVEAVGLANEAAGIVVGRFGPAVVSAAELVDGYGERGVS